MSSVLSCAAHVLAKAKEKGEMLSPKKREAVYKKITSLASEWEAGGRFKNIKDAKYNTPENFERIYEEYVGYSMDPVKAVVPNLKDLKKFEIGLEQFNNVVGVKDAAFTANIKLPRRILSKLPETKQMSDEIVAESSFFRLHNVDNNKRINDILKNFKKFTGIMGGDHKTYSLLESKMDLLIANKRAGRPYDDNLLQTLRTKKINMLTSKSGQSNLILSEVFQGRSISDLRDQYKFGSAEESLLRNMRREYSEVRKSNSKSLLRAIEKNYKYT